MMTKKQKTRWYVGFVVVLLGLGLIFASCNKDKSSNPILPAISGEGRADLIGGQGDGVKGAYYKKREEFFIISTDKGAVFKLVYEIINGGRFTILGESPEPFLLSIGLKPEDELGDACYQTGRWTKRIDEISDIYTSWKVKILYDGGNYWWGPKDDIPFKADSEEDCFIKNGKSRYPWKPPAGTTPTTTLGGTTTTLGGTTTTLGGTTTTLGGTTTTAASTTTTAASTTTTSTTTSTTTTTTTTTTTNPCPGGGVQVAGSTACWYLGADHEACSDQPSGSNPTSGTCNGKGQYHDDTASFAGQAGDDANCGAVLQALGIGTGAATANPGAPAPYNALGCGHYDSDGTSGGPIRTRYTGAATTHNGSTPGGEDEVARACGCTQ